MVSKKEERWSTLMSHIEAVVHTAFDMKRHEEMTEAQYQIFNNTIAHLEERARGLDGK